jgi:hypothetical protein
MPRKAGRKPLKPGARSADTPTDTGQAVRFVWRRHGARHEGLPTDSARGHLVMHTDFLIAEEMHDCLHGYLRANLRANLQANLHAYLHAYLHEGLHAALPQVQP